jgi:hypothetical protein
MYLLSSPPTVVEWTGHLRRTNTSLPLNQPWRTVAIDSHGCEFSTPGLPLPLSMRMQSPQKGLVFKADALQVFPRREREFKLRIFTRDQALGELTIHNPVYQRYPVWKPEPLPATRPVGNSNVTLVSFDNAWTLNPMINPLALDPALDASSANLRFIIQRPQMVEFLIQPKARIEDDPFPRMRPMMGPYLRRNAAHPPAGFN